MMVRQGGTTTATTEQGPVRVLLVDDHALLRAGIRAMVNAAGDLTVVGEAEDGFAAVALAQRLRPNVVVMDLDMPGVDGMAATREIIAQLPGVNVLILTMFPEDEHLLPVIDAGACGFVAKQSPGSELLDAIRMVARGEVFLYPSGVRLLLRAYRNGRDATPPVEALTVMEQAVLTLTAEGYTNTEIAARLAYSQKTIDFYRVRLMRKLGLHHRTELVRYALDHGLLRPE